ncbi:ABC transporter permease [Microlunatus sp. GCM10028923]|uniref:ABC transporter permease n=1 Tax=Microlunatus sp. GCM10028923 TaxID=3273400 RepID=UPI00361E73B0
MIRYLVRRIAGWLLMIFVATNITYFLANFYLKARSNFVGRNPPVPETVINGTLNQYNLNDQVNIFERWWIWISGIVTRWDWGRSPVGESVNDQIGFRVWISAELVLGATILMTLIGIGLGVYTASRQYKLADRVAQGTSIITLNIPVVVAALGIVLVAIQFNQAVGSTVFYVVGAQSDNISGFGPFLVDKAQHLILPTLVLVITGYAGTHFLQRSLLLDNINADYVRTARAKGLTKAQAVRRHALRTSLIPVATQIAFSIPGLFTGAILTETIFAWEGMGRYFAKTLSTNDVHGVVATAAFGALMTAVGAILSDLTIVVLDPRVRVS